MEPTNKKKIAILTSGGDAPGMNAVIAACAKTAKFHAAELIGIDYGYKGLLKSKFNPISMNKIDEYINRGGTFLGSARCPEFKDEKNVKQAVLNAKENGIDGLVVIGGDGSFRGARDLSLHGLPTIGVPATIDNDISCTDYTIGYDTALNTVIRCIDNINDTMRSHSRCAFVEVMGNKSGYLAIEVAISCGADAVLFVEKDFDIEKDIVDVIAKKYSEKKYFLVVVAEGVCKTLKTTTQDIANKTVASIREKHGIELDAKITVLGHVQRGGSPTYKDRIVGSRLGKYAVELLVRSVGNRVVGIKGGKVVDYDILEGLKMEKTIADELVDLSTITAI